MTSSSFGSYRPAVDHVFIATDGTYLALMPSAGLFFCGPARDPHAAQIVYHGRVAGTVVELVEIDRQRGLWVDILRLRRLIPVVLSELIQLTGWERAAHVLACRVDAVENVARVAATYGISAPNTVVPGGWVEGMADPLRSAPGAEALPRVLRLQLNFTDAEVELVGTRAAFLARAESSATGEIALAQQPCFLAIVRDKHARGCTISFTDLSAGDLGTLRRQMEEQQPGSFEALLADPADPEHAETVEFRRHQRLTGSDLRGVLAAAQAMTLQANGNPGAYLERVLGANADAADVDEHTRPALAEVLNLWALIERRAGHAGRALALLDKALGCSPDADVRQELLYSRGLVRLQATMSAPSAVRSGADPCCPVGGFPEEPGRSIIREWQHAHADLSNAVALDSYDGFAWYHFGVSALLLGAAGSGLPVRRRLQLLRAAAEAFDRALVDVGPDREAVADACARARKALDALGQLPWYRRAFGRTGKVQTGEQPVLPARQPTERVSGSSRAE